MKVLNFALIAALAAGLLFFSNETQAGVPFVTAPFVEPAPADQSAQGIRDNPVLIATVVVVVVLFGVLALFPLVAVSQEEGGTS